MKRNWNRTLAIFLSVCMLLSLFPAAGAVELEGETETAGVEADADRDLITDEGAPDPEPAESEDETETSDIPVTEEDESQTEPLPPDEDEEEGDTPAEEEPPAEMEPVPEEPSDESDSILNEEPPAEDAFYFEDAAPTEYDAEPAVTRSGWYQDSTTVKGEDAVCEDVSDGVHLKAGSSNGNGHASDSNSWPAIFVNDGISESLAEIDGAKFVEMTFTTERDPSDTRFGMYINYTDPANGFFVGYDASSHWFWEMYNNDSIDYNGSNVELPDAGTPVTVRLEWNGTTLTKLTVSNDGGEPQTVFSNIDFSGANNAGTQFGIKCATFNRDITEVVINRIEVGAVNENPGPSVEKPDKPNVSDLYDSNGAIMIFCTDVFCGKAAEGQGYNGNHWRGLRSFTISDVESNTEDNAAAYPYICKVTPADTPQSYIDAYNSTNPDFKHVLDETRSNSLEAVLYYSAADQRWELLADRAPNNGLRKEGDWYYLTIRMDRYATYSWQTADGEQIQKVSLCKAERDTVADPPEYTKDGTVFTFTSWTEGTDSLGNPTYTAAYSSTSVEPSKPGYAGDCGAVAETVFYEFNEETGVLRIYGEGKMKDYAQLAGSAGLKDPTLDKRSPWIAYNLPYTSVVIEDDITHISTYAFQKADLQTVEFPNTLTSIGAYAFFQSNLSGTIVVPESVTSMGQSVFSQTQIESVVLPGSITSVANWTFSGCSNLKNVTIPDGVKSIGEYAFFQCSSLTSIELPGTLTTIRNSAFGETGLTSVTLPDSVKTLENTAFWKNPNLASVDLGSVVTIRNQAFQDCPKLTSIELPNTLKSLGTAFRNTGITSITIPDGVEIQSQAFDQMGSLRSIVLLGTPKLATNSGGSFGWMDSMGENLIIYTDNDSIAETVGTVAEIGLRFSSKPEEVTDVFYFIANLDGGTAGAAAPGKLAPASKDGYDFQGWQADGAILDKDAGGYTPIPAGTARGTVYTAQWVEKTPEPDYDGECGKVPGTVFYKITDGELHIWGTGEMKDYTTNSNDRDNRAPWSGEMISSVVIDEGVTTVGVSAFSTYATSNADGIGTALTSVKLPSTLTKISNNAFLGCKLLTRVDIPEGVTAVGDKAFYLCNSLAYVTFPDSLRSIGSFGFADCALTSAELPAVETLGLSAFGLCKNLSHVDLGNSLRTIGNGAFSGCPKLTSITFPDTLKSIGSRGFEGNALTSVVIPDGVELDWMAFSNISALQNIVLLGTPNANSDKQPFSWTSTAAGPVIFYANGSAAIEKLKNGFGYFVHPKQRYFADTDGGILAAEVVAGKLAPLEKDGATFYGWMDSNGKVLTKGEDGYYAIPANTAKGTVYTAQWQEPTHEHNWSEWSVTTPVTCLTDGKESRTCGICDEVETRDIPTNGHSWSEWSVTTPAACLTAGEESRSCGVCGETETRSIPADGHGWSAWRVTTPATCVNGVESRTCACGAVETRALPAVSEHTWDNGTVTLAPTYTMEGERTFTCTVCHGTRTESIPVRTRPSTGGSSSGSGGSSSGGSTTPPPVVIEDLDTPLADLPFTDLTTGAWYEEAITYVYSKKLMDGSNDASFSPDAMMIRSEMAQVLYNLSALAGEPAAGSASCVFADVSDTNPNAAAILWSASHELVLGYGNGNFGPQDNISREQMALMLFRYAKFYGLELTWDEQVLEKFSDNAEISSWAREAMAWAVGCELIVGYGDDRVDPSGLTTRAQTASTIMRFHQMLEENSAG